MADLKDNRGQLLVVGAFALAVTFVALALILNSAIFTENLASRGETARADDSVQFRQETKSAVGSIMSYVNKLNNSDHTELESTLRDGVGNYSRLVSRRQARTGKVAEVSLVGVTDGARLRQRAQSRTYTNASGAADWTLAQSVEHTRAFRLNVDPTSDNFQLLVTGASGNSWRLNVTTSPNEVGIEDGAGNEATCTAGSAPFWINITDGTVDGEECDGLVFGENVTRPYEIAFRDGDAVQGNYTLFVDVTTPLTASDYATGGSPSADPAVYSADVRIVQESPELAYNHTLRVAPGETDD